MKTHLLRTMCASAFLFSPALYAATTTIDFDDLVAGSMVSTIEGVTFSSSVTPNSGLALVVSSIYDTSSGANYLGVNDGGTEAFFPGDTIDLQFAVPVTSLSVNFVSTANPPLNTFSITTPVGSSASGSLPDMGLPDTGEVFGVLFSSATPFSSAQLSGGAGGLQTYNVDDIAFSVVPVPPAIALLISGLLFLGGLGSRGNKAPGKRVAGINTGKTA